MKKEFGIPHDNLQLYLDEFMWRRRYLYNKPTNGLKEMMKCISLHWVEINKKY